MIQSDGQGQEEPTAICFRFWGLFQENSMRVKIVKNAERLALAVREGLGSGHTELGRNTPLLSNHFSFQVPTSL